MATRNNVSLSATLNGLRATEADPIRAEVRGVSRVTSRVYDYIPKADLDEDTEKSREARLCYLPSILGLSDSFLLGELGMWAYKLRKKPGAVITPGKPLDLFLAEMRSNAWKIREGILPGLSNSQRSAVIVACIGIRWQLVPIPFGNRPQIPEVDTPRKENRNKDLSGLPDWTLIQALASRVGSCDLFPYELHFIATRWRRAWEYGPESFLFDSKDYRRWAEDLYRSILDRDYCLSYDQGQMFRQMTGCLRRVPVWKTPETQGIFPELGGGQVRLKSAETTEQEERRRSQDPKQGDLLDVLELGYIVIGGDEQLLLPHSDDWPTWDGDGIQKDLF